MAVFSLIIPVYNSADFLEKCMDSILSQSFTDYEVILVDDGSTDNSIELCKSYHDDRIRLFEKENGGASSARNLGMEQASGDYIWFIDSDDWIAENSLQTIYHHLETNYVDMLVFDYHQIDMKGQLAPRKLSEINSTTYSGPAYVKAFKVLEPAPWTMVYKRSFLRNIGLRFEQGMVYEDFYFNLQAFRHAAKVRKIIDRLYYYRHRENSVTTSGWGKLNVESQLKVLSLLKQLYADQVFDDEYLSWRMKLDGYFLLMLFQYGNASVRPLRPYFERIKELELRIPTHYSDSWIDYLIKSAFNRNPRNGYLIHSVYHCAIKIKQKMSVLRERLFQHSARSLTE